MVAWLADYTNSTHGAEFWSEHAAVMQVWGDYLDELREGGVVSALMIAKAS